MADASIRPQRLRPFRRLRLPAWTGFATLVTRRMPASLLASSWAEAVRRGPDRAASKRETGEIVAAPSHTAFPLLNAYAASAMSLQQRARELDLDPGLRLGPVAVRALVAEVLQRLDPLAQKAELSLLRDIRSGCDGVCCADPALLRDVVSHLVLRALSLEQAPGHVRVAITLTAHEAHILVLSRTPETTMADHRDAARHDLVAPQRLLQAMGGSLVLEPRRAGYLRLCIALPALAAAAARRAA